MDVNTFALCPDPSGGFDAFIDGRFLRSMVYPGDDQARCPLTLMRRELDLDTALGQIRELTAEELGDLGDGRVWLYFCPVCFDPGCGGVSVRIDASERTVVWSDFSNALDPEFDEDDESEPLDNLGPFVFERTGYEKALGDLGVYLRALFAELHSPATLSGPVALGIGAGVSRHSLRLHDPKEGLQWTVGGLPLARILQKSLGRVVAKPERRKLAKLSHSPIQQRGTVYGQAGVEVLEMLLGKRVFAELPGRVPLLVSEHLEIPRGAITARVSRLGRTVLWDEFQAHDAGFAEPFHVFPHGLSYRFELQQHDELLLQTLDLL